MYTLENWDYPNFVDFALFLALGVILIKSV